MGVERAKNVFQLQGASMTVQLRFCKKLSWQSFSQFLTEQPPAVMALKAGGSAHYLAREMVGLSQKVKLNSPHYGKSFVKRQYYWAQRDGCSSALNW